MESRDDEVSFDGKPIPFLPGEEASFWEREQWDGFGFFERYMCAYNAFGRYWSCSAASRVL